MASDIKNVENKEDFEQILVSAKDSVVAVHFWAPWSEACQQMNEVFDELNKSPECKSVKFVKVEAEGVPELSLRYNIIAVPTFIFIKNGDVVDRLDGAYPPELAKKIKQFSSGLVSFAQTATSSNGFADKKEDLNSRLNRLINSYPCIVFMKGNESEPKCGFSKQLIALLNQTGADYKTFDILSDEEVRAGLKEFSQWPTYPQLYIKGELIGGLDIVRELLESNELQSKFPKKHSLDERLKTLINKAPIVVFMKGDANQPKCGFSQTLIGILNDSGAKYETFDILEDEEVRQGLKTFSNWPTYPQVYVKGELVGGLDIIKEMQTSGELKSTLNV